VERVRAEWKEGEGEAAENGWSIKHGGKKGHNLPGRKKYKGTTL
jgi:hypothetical protein